MATIAFCVDPFVAARAVNDESFKVKAHLARYFRPQTILSVWAVISNDAIISDGEPIQHRIGQEEM
jgi:hypothetical protein